jgi:hypothetical protein
MENKYEVSDEEILGYMRQGWRFHRKRVKKKYEYIIRRRRMIERSMGPFNEEFWNRIMGLEYTFYSEGEEERTPSSLHTSLTMRDRRRIVRSQERLNKTLRHLRGVQMAKKCVHVVDGFCRFWVWEHKEFFSGFYENILIPGSEYSRKIVSDEGVDEWIFRADSLYCAGCSAYTRRSND